MEHQANLDSTENWTTILRLSIPYPSTDYAISALYPMTTKTWVLYRVIPYSRVEINLSFASSAPFYFEKYKTNEQKLIQQNIGQTDRSVAVVRDALA